MEEPKFLVIDLFCGAGGTTTGFEMTNGLAKVIACVNHDADAIKSHWMNHPDVVHFEEDIRTLKLGPLRALTLKYRKMFPDAKLILWASLECTNFSKAKGGLPRDADSRTLANELERYIVVLDPDIIQIENVVEFMSWGPLDENGKPISKRNGFEWMRWRKEICEFGYVDEWNELNAADYGAYTSRNRLFGMFAKKRDWIYFPEKTHTKQETLVVNKGTSFQQTLFTSLQKWMPVKDVLDLKDEGNSIFGRNKNLSEKTLERIYAGLIKYVAGGEKAFIAKYYSGRPEGKVKSLNVPAGTIKCIDGHSIIQPVFLLKYNSINGKTGKHIPPSIEQPSPVIATQNRLGIIQTCFLQKYHGKGVNVHSIEEPARTIATKDQISKIQPIWLDKAYSGKHNHQSINCPAGTVLTNDKHSIVNSKFLLNPQWGINSGTSIEKPCFTLIARMDKTPPYLVSSNRGQLAIEIFESDSPATKLIKEFMACYGIVDVKMRMLKISELLKIQGFPDNYQLFGNQTNKKKFIGNAVHPLITKAWTKALVENLLRLAA